MLVWLGVCAVAAFLLAFAAGGGAVLPAPSFGSAAAHFLLTPAAAWHLAFACGALPLIFGAISHFVPVLTRSRPSEAVIHFLPLAVQAASLLVPLGQMGVLPQWSLHVAAGCDALAALLLLGWLGRRLRQSLGSAHPGVHWYGAALLCFFFALSLVPVWWALPALQPALRLFHLHLNTLGGIGLAALGTLPVLLPTAIRAAEPTAATRLRTDLVWALSGVLLIAAGAASGFWLAVPGAALLAGVIARDLVAWWRSHGMKIFMPHAAPLFLATLALLLLVAGGLAHGVGWMRARPALSGFLAMFLLPLTTGALAQLLPVWRYPGADSPARQAMQQRLAGGGRLRAVLFLLAGIGLLGDAPMIGWLALVALADFALRLIPALYNARHP